MLDLKHPSALQHDGRQYMPVMGKGEAKAAVLPGSKVVSFYLPILTFLKRNHPIRCILQGLVEPLDIKAVVTFQEHIEVPPMPDIQVPERYRVYNFCYSIMFCLSGTGCPNLRVFL